MAGSRRGQRQEFAPSERLRFGRHPDNDVSFDAHRDLDASSRHAELRVEDDGYLLVDVGSSNGTFIDGERITELQISPGVPVNVEFGAGGPRLRLFVGDDAAIAELPEIEPEEPEQPSVLPIGLLVAVGLALVALIGVIWWRAAG